MRRGHGDGRPTPGHPPLLLPLLCRKVDSYPGTLRHSQNRNTHSAYLDVGVEEEVQGERWRGRWSKALV